MPPVSASLLLRNEERRLPACLTSLKRLASIDEIVVLDTGSTDRTIEIARAFGCRVHEEPWQDDFSLHRNHCLDLCRNDWVFILDGDEELVDPGDLDDFFAAPPAAGVGVTVESHGVGTTAVETMWSLRGFDRRKGRWRYPIHNQVEGIQDAARSTGRIRAWHDGVFSPTHGGACRCCCEEPSGSQAIRTIPTTSRRRTECSGRWRMCSGGAASTSPWQERGVRGRLRCGVG